MDVGTWILLKYNLCIRVAISARGKYPGPGRQKEDPAFLYSSVRNLGSGKIIPAPHLPADGEHHSALFSGYRVFSTEASLRRDLTSIACRMRVGWSRIRWTLLTETAEPAGAGKDGNTKNAYDGFL